MKQQGFTNKKSKWLFAAHAALIALVLIIATVAKENGAEEDRTALLAQYGVKACIEPPTVDQPPIPEGDAFTGANAAAGPRQRPCPEGLVPQPIDRRVPKGRSLNASSMTDKAAGSRAAPSAPAAGAEFYYAGAYQWVISPGASAFMSQHLPWVMPADYHSLAEMAVESTDLRQIVEVGWIVDRSLNGDEYPHLFVYHWVDGAASCYNGCGWVQTSATRFPGMRLTYDGSASQYMIQYREGNWWVGYQGEWIGYFPGSLWNGVFTESGLIQWFGELASVPSTTAPLSSIGNYYHGTSGHANTAQITKISLFDSAGAIQGPATLSFYSSDSAMYNTSPVGESNGFSYGGHGESP